MSRLLTHHWSLLLNQLPALPGSLRCFNCGIASNEQRQRYTHGAHNQYQHEGIVQGHRGYLLPNTRLENLGVLASR